MHELSNFTYHATTTLGGFVHIFYNKAKTEKVKGKKTIRACFLYIVVCNICFVRLVHPNSNS